MVNMMSVSDALSPCLPQYHPLVLSELTNGGHLEMVKHILINLTVAINRQFESAEGYVQMEPLRLKKFDMIGLVLVVVLLENKDHWVVKCSCID